MRALPNTRACFVCGLENPAGLQLRFETDGEIARSTFAFRPDHVGFRSTVHGGILATVLDEIMVWSIGVQKKRFAYCAELTVRYVSPARPGESLVATGRLTLDRRGRIYETEGDIRRPDGQVVATATGKYMPIKGPETSAMLADLIGPVEALGFPPSNEAC